MLELNQTGRATSLSSPTHVLLILTYRCNFRCPNCLVFDPVRYWRPDPAIQLQPAVVRMEMTSTQIVERLIPQCEAAGVKVVALTGGEVLIRQDAMEIFAALGRSNLEWCMDSNLSLCTREVAEAVIEASCDTIFASMDGPPEIHNRLRDSKFAYKVFHAGLTHLLEARAGISAARTKIVLNCVLQTDNENLAPDVVKIASGLGVDRVSFQLMSSLEYRHNFDANAAASAIKAASRIGEKSGVAVSVFPITEPTPADLTRWFAQEPSKTFFHSCNYIHSSLRIDPSGNVIPCVEHKMGNVLEEDLLNIWRGANYEMFRDHIAQTPIKACYRCCNMNSCRRNDDEI